MYFDPLSIKIVGMGGIGSNLLHPLLRWNEYAMKLPVTLIDGDTLEAKNLERQNFIHTSVGQNKAEALVNSLVGLSFQMNFIPSFLNESNVADIIHDNDIIMVGVDNYKTRVIIQNYIKELDNVFCIFMGNEYIDGDVLLFLRVRSKNITIPIDEAHPELLTKIDKLPNEMSCEELMRTSVPQIIFTNLTAAAFGLNALYKFINGKIDRSEFFFDIEKMAGRSTQNGIIEKGI